MGEKKEYVERGSLVGILNAKSDMAMGTPKVVFANAAKMVELLPAADVVEVRHGTWYHGTEYGSAYAKCSACGRKMNYSCYGYAYCALCGARMDGERKEQT